jgi:hypothetical protein
VFGVAKLAQSLVKYAEKTKKKGVTAFGDIGSFFLLERITELMNYELSLPRMFDMQFKAFCSYHQADFDTPSEQQK